MKTTKNTPKQTPAITTKASSKHKTHNSGEPSYHGSKQFTRPSKSVEKQQQHPSNNKLILDKSLDLQDYFNQPITINTQKTARSNPLKHQTTLKRKTNSSGLEKISSQAVKKPMRQLNSSIGFSRTQHLSTLPKKRPVSTCSHIGPVSKTLGLDRINLAGLQFNLNHLVTDEDFVLNDEQQQSQMIYEISDQRKQPKKLVIQREQTSKKPFLTPGRAAIIIQRVWRGYQTRKLIKFYQRMLRGANGQKNRFKASSQHQIKLGPSKKANSSDKQSLIKAGQFPTLSHNRRQQKFENNTVVSIKVNDRIKVKPNSNDPLDETYKKIEWIKESIDSLSVETNKQSSQQYTTNNILEKLKEEEIRKWDSVMSMINKLPQNTQKDAQLVSLILAKIQVNKEELESIHTKNTIQPENAFLKPTKRVKLQQHKQSPVLQLKRNQSSQLVEEQQQLHLKTLQEELENIRFKQILELDKFEHKFANDLIDQEQLQLNRERIRNKYLEQKNEVKAQKTQINFSLHTDDNHLMLREAELLNRPPGKDLNSLRNSISSKSLLDSFINSRPQLTQQHELDSKKSQPSSMQELPQPDFRKQYQHANDQLIRSADNLTSNEEQESDQQFISPMQNIDDQIAREKPEEQKGSEFEEASAAYNNLKLQYIENEQSESDDNSDMFRPFQNEEDKMSEDKTIHDEDRTRMSQIEHTEKIEEELEKLLLQETIEEIFMHEGLYKLMQPLIDIHHTYEFTKILDRDVGLFMDQIQDLFMPPRTQILQRLNQKMNPSPSELLKILRDQELSSSEGNAEFYELVIPEECFKKFREWKQQSIPIQLKAYDRQTQEAMKGLKNPLRDVIQSRRVGLRDKLKRLLKFEKDLQAMYFKSVFNCLNEYIIQVKSSYSSLNGRSTISAGQLKVAMLDCNQPVTLAQVDPIIQKAKERVLATVKHKCPKLDASNYDSLFNFQSRLTKQIQHQFELYQCKWVSFFDEFLELAMEAARLVEEALMAEAVTELALLL